MISIVKPFNQSQNFQYIHHNFLKLKIPIQFKYESTKTNCFVTKFLKRQYFSQFDMPTPMIFFLLLFFFLFMIPLNKISYVMVFLLPSKFYIFNLGIQFTIVSSLCGVCPCISRVVLCNTFCCILVFWCTVYTGACP